MAAFTAQDVKTLREKTGCGMMDCKKALTNADGDMDKAVDFLREQGLAKQAKKAGRIAAEGVAYACTNDDLSVGVVVEVNAETDFVAKNDSFMDFVKACANTIIEQNPADVEALLTLKATGSEQTIAEMLQEKVLTIGENIQIRRFERMEGACVAYVHAGGKIGVLVNFDTDLAAKPEFVAYGKDETVWIYVFENGKSYRLTPERENTQFLGVSGGYVMWMDVTSRERDIIKYALPPL